MCPTAVTLFLSLLASTTITAWGPARIIQHGGHYPGTWCEVQDVMLSSSRQAFLYQPGQENIRDKCNMINNIWPFQADPNVTQEQCDQIYDEGYAFTIYYFGRGSNYYHLHYDMMIPLYHALHSNPDLSHETTRILMPSVESSRLEIMNWKTDAFGDPLKYWMQLIKLLVKNNIKVFPLDQNLLRSSSNMCFKSVYFGTPRVDYGNAEMMKGFAEFVKSQLHVLERPLTVGNLRVGLISRNNRRRILNEAELLDTVRPNVEIDLLKFEGLTIREQVALVQRYAVIVGMNGAGLMNALFRPRHAVAVQLVPFKAQVNHLEFGKILQSVGSYLVWHNTHLNLHYQSNHDKNNNSPDTIVDAKQFKELVLEALDIARDNILDIKEEL